MQLIARDAYQQMPWKNGGGTTTQIAIFPHGATSADFEWRVSMATVRTDGPFSEFPGIDRTLVVLEGAGIDLFVAGRQSVRIDRATEPFGFPADIITGATLIDGPILDLNVMTQRDRFSHRVRRFSEPKSWETGGDMTVVFAQGTALRIDADTNRIKAGLGDTFILASGTKTVEVIPEVSGNYYLIEFVKM